MENYLTQHPKPQMRRENWRCLNGIWEFEVDAGESGRQRNMHLNSYAYSDHIQVPFCPESNLSGFCNRDFMNAVWYRRKISISNDDMKNRVFLHFGAVDYACSLFLNEKFVGRHTGGYASFFFDITDFIHVGENTICLFVRDPIHDPMVPRGKQSEEYLSHLCDYTRTTGIWQTVWLEMRPEKHIKSVKYYPDIDNSQLTVVADLQGSGCFAVEAFFDGKSMGNARVSSHGGIAVVTFKLAELHLWEVGKGCLYDLSLTFEEDRVESYVGFRDIRYDGMKFLLNGKPTFQRLVLNQGFYPDSIYTASSDEEIIKDLQLILEFGFNGCRLHEKIFEERYLYYCDKMGLMVWEEFPDWGVDVSKPESALHILPEWLEIIERDRNHPSIICWCPHNETWDYNGMRQCDEAVRFLYEATKKADPTRFCIDTSGLYHVKTDIYDLHDYEQDAQILAEHYAGLKTGGKPYDRFDNRQHYSGEPVIISEFGGIGWKAENGWSYDNEPVAEEKEFLSKLKSQVDALMDNPKISGFCYTQLTDVEQEKNGLVYYDRRYKTAPDKIHPIFSRESASEKE